MRILLAAFSFISLIVLLSDCQGKFPERCDHYYDADCGNLCPEGCPDSCCCGDCDVDTCLNKPGFDCEGCCCEEDVTCLTDTCADITGFVCRGCCCIVGVTCLEDTCPLDQCSEPNTWVRLFGEGGDDEGWGIIQTSDDKFVITGRYGDTENANDNVYLLKIDDNGDSDWTYHLVYGDDKLDEEYGTDLMELDGGDLVIQGNKFKDGNNWQFYLIRTDSEGIPRWKAYNFGLSQIDLGFSIVQKTENTGFLMYGYTGTYQTSDMLQSVIYEADNAGVSGSRWPVGESLDDYGSCIEVAHDGNYLLLTTIGTGSGSKLMLYKLNYQDLKIIIWQTEIISNCISKQRACVRKIGESSSSASDTSYVVAAAAVTGAMRVTRVRTDGTVVDFLSYPNILITESVSVTPTQDGGFAVLSDKMTLAKIKPDFTADWEEDYDGESLGVHSLIEAKEGGFVMTGFRDNGSDKQLLVIKTNTKGKVDQP